VAERNPLPEAVGVAVAEEVADHILDHPEPVEVVAGHSRLAVAAVAAARPTFTPP
jgi:DNA-binding LytR/AlgR family response regulator